MPTLRVLNIFEAIYNSKKGLTLTEISHNTGIAKGTLHPIITTLVKKEYLENTGTVISIGKSAFKLGYAYAHSLSYLYILKPHMREIVIACDEICQLGVLDGNDVLYIEKTEPKQAIRIESSAGKTIKAYATALGRCLLSDLSSKEIAALYPEGLSAYTANTVTDKNTLLKILSAVRQKGYAHEVGETNIDIECIAVPIKIKNKIYAAISVSLPIFRSNPEKIMHIINVLQFHQRAIETEISALPDGIKLFSD
ncbi:IclR family transcriptional regulator [Pectinatus cerevisiiphilus]|uniref:IclR family transcriptional regulator n=1 Tax=Pectinatus cerevisiiphilus TaxID=86956 RepID=A0A4R3K778_9FIRM|nr:IclR family transcriptional regulator [Pectinatus cerevisiiphilus]TCS78699.1 IclR family transcriptional regulator [Pectinatus cerevisiiphilus]